MIYTLQQGNVTFVTKSAKLCTDFLSGMQQKSSDPIKRSVKLPNGEWVESKIINQNQIIYE